MVNTKQLRTRLKSIRNTKKITKAMEMVAASKMKKVIRRALATREYSQTAWEILNKISSEVAKTHPLLKYREVENICLIVVTSNKGLCGGLNSQIMRKVLQNINSPYNMMINRIGEMKLLPKIDPKDVKIDLVSVGKKGEAEIIKNKLNLIASFNGFNEQTTFNDLAPLSKIAIDGYTQKKYDKVIIAYTDFISTVLNKPRLRQVLPISKKDLEKQLEELGKGISEKEEMEEVKEDVKKRFYTFEPDRQKFFKRIVPSVVEIQIYQAFLEFQAAEFSSRMLTMKNASDTAGEMIYNFNLQYNQLRQAAITSELAEISGGMVALE